VIVVFVQPGKGSYVFLKEWDRVYQKALEKRILILGVHSGMLFILFIQLSITFSAGVVGFFLFPFLLVIML
jgi:hypothetical protein